MPDKPEKLADSTDSARTIPDEMKDHDEVPAGSVVDPAEVIPPIVPAPTQKTHTSWARPLIIALVVLIIIAAIVIGQ